MRCQCFKEVLHDFLVFLYVLLHAKLFVCCHNDIYCCVDLFVLLYYDCK
jgi:hypothetical protein